MRWVISEERWPASSLTKLRNGSDYQQLEVLHCGLSFKSLKQFICWLFKENDNELTVLITQLQQLPCFIYNPLMKTFVLFLSTSVGYIFPNQI